MSKTNVSETFEWQHSGIKHIFRKTLTYSQYIQHTIDTGVLHTYAICVCIAGYQVFEDIRIVLSAK